MRSLFAAALLLAAAIAGPSGAAEATIRTYPSGSLYAFPLDSVRGVQSLLVHNVAVINTTGAPMTVTSLEFALLREGQAVETRTLAGAEIARAAKGGAGLQAGGMIEAIGFQFGDVLGKPAAKLPATPTLAPGEGLLVMSQVFSWAGPRDALRITARGENGATASLTLKIVNDPPAPRYIFPLRGVFYVQAGASLNTHHRWAVPEEFALDVGQLGTGGLSYRGDGTKFTDYYVYGLPVLAAADGEVVKVVSGLPEDPTAIRKPGETQAAYLDRIRAWQGAMMAQGMDTIGGNTVIIRHAWGEYSVYAHLKPGASPVKVGQVVKAGDVVGYVGSSGSSTEPHLHFQVCDAPSALACAGRPVTFTNVENPMALLPGAIQSGDLVVTK